tara:strand:+ start:163 stop:645 length:483 start_codon:yes stop_codon:yes gene_type:complete
MPSFDIVSEFDKQEVVNAIDQSGREIVNRYDFKNTNTTISLNENQINLRSTTEDRALAAEQVMREKFSKRNVSIKFLSDKKVEKTPSEIKFIFNLKSGINQEESKEITKLIKDYNKKIQTSFQNQIIRVTSKKRDDLQNVITLLKESNIKTPLSYINFRD